MPKSVMIVEDNELNMKLFNDLLESRGYNVIQTRNGMEALDLARAHMPDLILMDIQLPEVSGLVVTISRPAQVDEYLFASGKRANPADLALLEKYDRLASAKYCRPGCGECLDACPAGLPIDDVLRYTMYFDTYGAEREAMKQYSALLSERGHGAEVCASCAAPCEAKCPFDIPIKDKLGRADRLLRLPT